MSTYLQNPTKVERKWYVIDAAGKPLGRVAAKAAVLLNGKHKVTYTPNVDCGDHVIIINCKDAVLTGNKLTQKKWQRHTGYMKKMSKSLPFLSKSFGSATRRIARIFCEVFLRKCLRGASMLS